jgi:hypothetical protein
LGKIVKSRRFTKKFLAFYFDISAKVRTFANRNNNKLNIIKHMKTMIYTLEMEHIQLIHGSSTTTVEVEATSWNEAMIKALQMEEYKDVSMNSIQAISVKNK